MMKPTAFLTGVFAIAATVADAQHGLRWGNRRASCTSETAVQRKEYGSMADHEKLAYINGVQCLMQQPSQYAAGIMPAATSRWLDFTATHVEQSLHIHIDGLLLPWHRHFLYLLEQALQQDCGYPKSLGIPYWDYPLYPSLADSPIFDGSNTSLGSNGRATDLCIDKGPFSNSTITFGPFDPRVTFNITQPPNWQEPNPQCIRRQFNDDSLQTNNNQSIIDALLASPDITTVQLWLDAAKGLFGFTDRGLHGGGHLAVGGMMGDFFGSPQDPAFFLHHAQLDRLWAEWQDRHPDLRYTYNGTTVIFNPPGAPEVDNSTVMTFGVAGDAITVGDTADPMGMTPYCYVYL